MSRRLRFHLPDAIWHVYSRGNDRMDTFRDDYDRAVFLRLLAASVRRFGWNCQTYTLMDNHHHLILETPKPTLPDGMRWLLGQYADAFNLRHRRRGHLYGDRYEALPIDSEEYLLEVSRYVVLNPVAAGMVPAAESWPWSSYRATVGMAPVPSWLSPDRLLRRLSDDPVRAREIYAGLVNERDAIPRAWEAVNGQLYLRGRDMLTYERYPGQAADEQVLAVRSLFLEILRRIDLTPFLSSKEVNGARAMTAHIARRTMSVTLAQIARGVGLGSEKRIRQLLADWDSFEESDPRLRLI
ncbi:MAG TPA: transposase, partial [Thermoanaerobaculia bacterium]|nr:transposase [Thermoanaerobaculia bacterium]